MKVVLTVEQTEGCHGDLILWGAALDWLPRLRGDPGKHQTHPLSCQRLFVLILVLCVSQRLSGTSTSSW